jgi:hypothetical protein
MTGSGARQGAPPTTVGTPPPSLLSGSQRTPTTEGLSAPRPGSAAPQLSGSTPSRASLELQAVRSRHYAESERPPSAD